MTTITPLLSVDPHPLLALRCFLTDFPHPLRAYKSEALEVFPNNALAEVELNDEFRPAVRELLPHGGFKATGRNKPASEYLNNTAARGNLKPINLAVDVGNAVSLQSGLPINVVDFDRLRPPSRVGIAPPESEYIFNPAGQTIRLGGLLCLFDQDGPCANGVKDSQRTKTSPGTRRTLSLIWGTTALANREFEAEARSHKILDKYASKLRFV